MVIEGYFRAFGRRIITYEKLEVLGIDSVIIEKIEPYKFSIDFRQTGTFDEFQLEHNE